MAGNYMNAPASRLAYDRDGSIGAYISVSGILDPLTASELRSINSEAETGVAFASQNRAAIIFPAPVDIAAIFLATSATTTWTVETSKDTTTGLDGTWTQHATGLTMNQDVKPNYRIESRLIATTPGSPSTGVRGVRVTTTANTTAVLRALHIYADISGLATTDRLAFWHPTLNAEVPPSYFDWGDVPRGSSADKSFRIKNMSGDLTANDITVFVEAITAGTPSVAGMHSISVNGGATFLNSGDIAELSPGEISDVLIVRRVVPLNAQVSVWSARLAADVTSWTA